MQGPVLPESCTAEAGGTGLHLTMRRYSRDINSGPSLTSPERGAVELGMQDPASPVEGAVESSIQDPALPEGTQLK